MTSVVCVFAASLLVVVFAITFSMHLEKWRERKNTKNGGFLLSVRTNRNQIHNVAYRQWWACPMAAERAMQKLDQKRCLVFRQGTAWFVVAGDDLTVQPDRNGSVNVRFTQTRAPNLKWTDDGTVTLQQKPEPEAAGIVTSTAGIVTSAARSTPTYDTHDPSWDIFPDSVIAMTAIDATHPIEQFATLDKARARVDMDAAADRYIVGGSPTDSTSYVMGVRAADTVVVPVLSGSTVHRRKKN